MASEIIENFFVQAEPRPRSNRYVIGAFETGITLYKQQVRALNLLHALSEKKRLSPGAKIAIVGGGVAGVTAAAASIALGYETSLFERRPILCHLQHGCDTRWIHPRIYDWPTEGSEGVFAGLPLLSWRAGTASEVIEQILQGFDQLVDEVQKAKGKEMLHKHLGATVSFPAPVRQPLRLKWRNSLGEPASDETQFEAIIFAVGFGVELAIENSDTPSYWRNDDMNQPEPISNKIRRYLISGVGDGGLIDLLRVRLESYNQGRIVREMFGSEPKEPREKELLEKLREIAKNWEQNSQAEQTTWLFDQYRELAESGLLTPLLDRLKNRLRKDATAILNGKAPSLAYALRLDHASLFHTLLVYCLDRLDAFDYSEGKCTIPDPKSQVLIDEKAVKVQRAILRHGTDRAAVLSQAGCEEGAQAIKQDVVRRRIDTSRPLWPAGWWSERFEHRQRKERIEFVPPATKIIATTFLSTLSDILQLQHSNMPNPEFRMVLHRLVKIQDEELFQQVSRYAGTPSAGPRIVEGTEGRVFSVKTGLVGLACRLGKPVIFHQKDEHFGEIWDQLGLPARPIDQSVQSLLACPFFAPDLEKGQQHVALVLFIDSSKAGFFIDDVLTTIYAACRGFVRNLEDMQKNEEIFFSSSAYPGYLVQPLSGDRDLVARYSNSIEPENKVFKDFVRYLTFSTIKTFDVDSRLSSYARTSNTSK